MTVQDLVQYLAARGLSLPIQHVFRHEQIDTEALDIILRDEYGDLDWLHILYMTSNDWDIVNRWGGLCGSRGTIRTANWMRQQGLLSRINHNNAPELVYPGCED